jgi:hypothetical protein
MPKGPKGEGRKADVIGNAVHVMRIATGQVEEAAAHPGHAPEAGTQGTVQGPNFKLIQCQLALAPGLGMVFA